MTWRRPACSNGYPFGVLGCRRTRQVKLANAGIHFDNICVVANKPEIVEAVCIGPSLLQTNASNAELAVLDYLEEWAKRCGIVTHLLPL